MTAWAREEAEALECGLLMHGHFSTEDAAERCEHSNILAIESALLRAFAAGREEAAKIADEIGRIEHNSLPDDKESGENVAKAIADRIRGKECVF